MHVIERDVFNAVHHWYEAHRQQWKIHHSQISWIAYAHFSFNHHELEIAKAWERRINHLMKIEAELDTPPGS
jgi:hypothetical protein